MRTVETKVYEFAELSDKAKEKARQWHYECFDSDDFQFVIEDAKACGKIIGFDIEHVYFSGFASQGDGACFEGSFSYAPDCVAAIKAQTQEAELLEIAQAWETLQNANNNALSGNVKHQGHYSHDQCTRIYARREKDGEIDYEFDTDDSYVRDNSEPGAEAVRIMRRFMRWIYKQLDAQNDFLLSDEYIEENMASNGYTFTADGKRFG